MRRDCGHVAHWWYGDSECDRPKGHQGFHAVSGAGLQWDGKGNQQLGPAPAATVTERFGPVKSDFGGDFMAEPVHEGVELEIDAGQDSSGYTIISWQDAEALKHWLTWALDCRAER